MSCFSGNPKYKGIRSQFARARITPLINTVEERDPAVFDSAVETVINKLLAAPPPKSPSPEVKLTK